MFRSIFCAVGALLVAGCTVVQVKPLARATYNVSLVCIEQNDAVKMAGFLPMVEKSFTDHGISTQRYQGKPPAGCEYTASYVAHWTWDVAYYMTDADVVVRRGGEVVGTATYHLRNKGGLDLGKWSSAEGKMRPVLDQLLADFTGAGGISKPLVTVTGDSALIAPITPAVSDPKYAKLADLKRLLDSGTITQAEFDAEKAKVLNAP